MAHNSFILKGWSVTLIIALFALFNEKIGFELLIISGIPILIFWLLDSFYLSQERLYRALYDEVRVKENDAIDFSMKVEYFKKGRNTWWMSFFAPSVLGFYLSLLLVEIIIVIILK